MKYEVQFNRQVFSVPSEKHSKQNKIYFPSGIMLLCSKLPRHQEYTQIGYLIRLP